MGQSGRLQENPSRTLKILAHQMRPRCREKPYRRRTGAPKQLLIPQKTKNVPSHPKSNYVPVKNSVYSVTERKTCFSTHNASDTTWRPYSPVLTRATRVRRDATGDGLSPTRLPPRTPLPSPTRPPALPPTSPRAGASPPATRLARLPPRARSARRPQTRASLTGTQAQAERRGAEGRAG